MLAFNHSGRCIYTQHEHEGYPACAELNRENLVYGGLEPISVQGFTPATQVPALTSFGSPASFRKRKPKAASRWRFPKKRRK
jgi:hypothetical protein